MNVDVERLMSEDERIKREAEEKRNEVDIQDVEMASLKATIAKKFSKKRRHDDDDVEVVAVKKKLPNSASGSALIAKGHKFVEEMRKNRTWKRNPQFKKPKCD